MGPKIAYIVSRFPHLPETFILREIDMMEQFGWNIELFPLIHQTQPVIHAEAEAWAARVNRPVLSDLIGANLRLLAESPGKYLSTWVRMIVANLRSVGFLLRALFLFPKAVWMASAMQGQGISHIHAHYATHPALAAWVIHHLTGISYSVTVHAHDIFVDRTMLALKLREAAGVVAISEFNRQFLIDHLGPWVAANMHVIHCGIDPGRYLPRAHQRRADGIFEILSIGSLQPYKGQTSLIEACALLHRRGVVFRCRIIGGGELYGSLLSQIRENHLEGCVELLGPKTQDEVARLLADADCYVQPSIITRAGKMEGIPVALMEAMASGVPVVATSISGVPELVRNGETGLLVPPAAPSALADALEDVCRHAAQARQRSEQARALVLQDFDLRQNVGALSALLTSLL